jgi:DNA-directed RNA polymerase specialized sigma24 family protein
MEAVLELTEAGVKLIEEAERNRCSVERLHFVAAKLPAKQRAILMGHLDAGIPLADLAAMHRVTVATMRKRLNEIRNRISKTLAA